MISLMTYLKFVKHINDHAVIPFKWGTADCCTFAVKAHDILQNDNLLDSFYEKYDDQKSAIRYFHKYFKVEELLMEKGYSHLLEDEDFQDGDILFSMHHKIVPALAISAGDWFYGMADPGGLYKWNHNTVDRKKVWRKR